MDIKFDASDFFSKIPGAITAAENAGKQAIKDIATEILRLSQFEVPHDTGALQNSGHVEDNGAEQVVGYNKVYAARLHENPQYHFQKGRKGKYLEDPIKNNVAIFTKFLEAAVRGAL